MVKAIVYTPDGIITKKIFTPNGKVSRNPIRILKTAFIMGFYLAISIVSIEFMFIFLFRSDLFWTWIPNPFILPITGFLLIALLMIAYLTIYGIQEGTTIEVLDEEKFKKGLIGVK